jgi:hypothetical protein
LFSPYCGGSLLLLKLEDIFHILIDADYFSLFMLFFFDPIDVDYLLSQ